MGHLDFLYTNYECILLLVYITKWFFINLLYFLTFMKYNYLFLKYSSELLIQYFFTRFLIVNTT